MRVLVLAKRNFLEIMRDKVSLFLGIVMPTSFLGLFYLIGKNLPAMEMFSVPSLTPGVVVFGFAFLSMFTGIMIAKDLSGGLLDRIFTTPIRTWEVTLAYAIPYIPIAIIQIIVGFTAALFMGLEFTTGTLLAMLSLIPIAIASIGLGLIMGAYLSEGQISAVGSIYVTFISLFGGAWMDLQMIGGFLNDVGYAMPFAHAIDVARELLGIDRHLDFERSLFISIGASVLMYATGVVLFHLKMKK